MSARQYWTVFREQRRLILGVVLGTVLLAGLAGAALPPGYTSTATFYVASPQVATSSSDSYQGAQLSSERVKSYSELLTGPRVAADASILLGGSPAPDEIQDSVSADAVSETVVLTLGVTESTPEEAQTVAAAVTTAFTRLVGSLESTGQPVNRPIVTTEVILPPNLPTDPSGPSPAMLLAAGVLVGAVLGVGAALVRRALRRVVDTDAALAGLLGAPVLGHIPGGRFAPRRPAVLEEPSTLRSGGRARAVRARAESFRRLRTAGRTVGGSRRSLVVTGAGAGQATSTTALELAATFAAAGERVLLVDADLRRPSLAARTGLDDAPGLADVLLGTVDPDAAVQRWETGGMDVLTAGSPVARPNEVLAHCGPVLTRLAGAYRRVVVDTPSAAGAADAIDLGRVVDGVLVVGRRGRAVPDDVVRAASALRLVGARVLGGVLTDDDAVPDAPASSRRGPVAVPAPAPAPDLAPSAITGPLPLGSAWGGTDLAVPHADGGDGEDDEDRDADDGAPLTADQVPDRF